MPAPGLRAETVSRSDSYSEGWHPW